MGVCRRVEGEAGVVLEALEEVRTEVLSKGWIELGSIREVLVEKSLERVVWEGALLAL